MVFGYLTTQFDYTGDMDLKDMKKYELWVAICNEAIVADVHYFNVH
jgi:hypothetical protein